MLDDSSYVCASRFDLLFGRGIQRGDHRCSARIFQQEGDHSAVTGGEGTEQIDAFMPTVIVNVPFKNGHSVTLDIGADAYSSVSSDNINPNTVSGASLSGIRIHGGATYSKGFKDKGLILGISGSFSI